jgi:nitrite reductase (NO-forming)
MTKYIITIISILILLTVMLDFTAYSSNAAGRDKELFITNCSKCHRKDGKGIKGIYPPLKESDYLRNNDKIEILRGMLYGRSGNIVVNGSTFNGVMTTELDKSVSDDDAALILTYVYREMNGMNIAVNGNDVKTARKAGKLPVKK